MRKILFVLMLAVTGCFAATLTGGTVVVQEKNGEATELKALVERARWGDKEAFLKLADCYHDGKGVKRDFLEMVCMLIQANDGENLDAMRKYMEKYPADDEYRCLFNAFDMLISEGDEKRDSIVRACYAINTSDAYALLAMMVNDDRDSLRCLEMIKTAKEKGVSSFSVISSELYNIRYGNGADFAELEEMAVSFPVVYSFIAKEYRDRGEYKKCAEYCLKAEKHAMLLKRDVRWLLYYCWKDSTPSLSEEDIRRIRCFAGVDKEDEVVDSVCVEPDCLDSLVVDTVAVDTVCWNGEVVDSVVVSGNGVMQIDLDAVRCRQR